jgi:DNA-binding winged helix-turn-helix (wHTH) protein
MGLPCDWTSDTFVDFDRGLNKAINRIRQTLGDLAASPRFVETLPRRGAIRGYLAKARLAAMKADSRSAVAALDQAILVLEQGPVTG